MPCCHGQDFDALFSEKTARKELVKYQQKGPVGATAKLLAAVHAQCPEPTSAIDIGGGIGVLQHELMGQGADVTSVDASSHYVEVATDEARRRGQAERLKAVAGDFVTVAPHVEPAQVVTLDKVICCYPHMVDLVRLSAERALGLYAIVLPRDRWWARLAFGGFNLCLRVLRKPFRGFVHRRRAVDGVVEQAGLRLASEDAHWMWSIRVYSRLGATP